MADYMKNRQQGHTRASGTSGKPGKPGGVAAFLDYHSPWQILLPPWGYTAESPRSPDGPYQDGLVDEMAAALKKTSGDADFKAIREMRTPDAGTGSDWAYGELGVRATLAVQLNGMTSDEAAINWGYCLPRKQIHSVGTEQFAGFLALVAYLQTNGFEPSTMGFLNETSTMGQAVTSRGAASGPSTLGLAVTSRGDANGTWKPGSLFLVFVLAAMLAFASGCYRRFHEAISRRGGTGVDVHDESFGDGDEFNALGGKRSIDDGVDPCLHGRASSSSSS